MSEIQTVSISEMAEMIISDYKGKGKPVPYAAKPYIMAMRTLHSITDNYGLDDGRSIVAYALSNLSGWRGDTAKAVKAELRRRLG